MSAGTPSVAADVEAGTLSAEVVNRPEGDAATAFLRRAQLAEDRLSEVLDAYRTLKKENEAHRERVTRNLDRRYEGRRERLVVRFIEILDNLDRALEAAETSFASPALVEGLILVRTQLLQTLKDEGLERIPVLGLPYDPHHSEAVETVAVDDADQHHMVVKELLRGYRLNGRVARASRVVVGQYAEDEGERQRWEPPTAQPFAPPTPQPFRTTATPESFQPPAAQARGNDELTLDEIIARAEAHEGSLPAEPGEGGPDARRAAQDNLETGDEVLGYVGDDDDAPKEDDRG